MYELVITCTVCGGVRSIGNLTEHPNLNDAEVLAKAGHSPDCSIALPGNGIVQETPRSDEPNTMLYEIREVS